jgi:imidazolonepropionase-like amidohydrolase
MFTLIFNPNKTPRNMKFIPSIFILASILSPCFFIAQDIPTPAPKQSEKICVHGATIHIGNGQVIENGVLVLENGKFTQVSPANTLDIKTLNCKLIDASGQHIYPALIGLNTYLGLSEIEAVRATNDGAEQGSQNANVRTIVSYNTDSRVTPTVRSNGVLYAQIVPGGGLVSGTTSLVQLDAWNWEDAAILTEEGVVLNWPSLQRKMGWWADAKGYEPNKEYDQQRQDIIDYFLEAKSYSGSSVEKKNLRFESLQEVVKGKRKLYINVQHIKEILHAIDFAEQMGLQITLIGAADAYMIADILAQKKISVILGRTHELPNYADEDIYQPYKTPAILQKAGVLYAISNEGFWQVRNLAFQAGQAVPYGLTKEQALTSITLHPAKILGIDHRIGTIELGKDASFILSTGDVLDMRTSQITRAFIDGRSINLGNKQTDLYHKFIEKYGLKVR